MRILVTGSRNWPDPTPIVDTLISHTKTTPRKAVVIVHGKCPTGADQIANDIAEMFGWGIETHPADWQTYGKRAGFVRNAKMVELGADICLAFIKDGSKGATMCADLAEKAGIPVRRYR